MTTFKTGDTALDRDGRVEAECDGHPAGPFDPMGETVYCDGSCIPTTKEDTIGDEITGDEYGAFDAPRGS